MRNIPEDLMERLMASDIGCLSTPAEDYAFDLVGEPFTFEGGEFFRYFCSFWQTWEVRRTVDLAHRTVLPIPEGDRYGTLEINGLSFLPDPMPHDVDGDISRVSFFYRGREFGWLMASPAIGWEIVSRHDRAGSDVEHGSLDW